MSRLLPLAVSALLWPAALLAEPIELDAKTKQNVLAIRDRDPERHDDRFAKMGGSSAASKAFLHCLASPYVDLAERPELEDTITYFKTDRRNSFNRQSKAAGVSWSLKYALGGKPANFRKEVNATDARWALVLFGGNDAQNQNERIYARRLVYLVEELEEMGVVPVLGSAAPRRNTTRDRWIQRFNAVTEAVARHWNLPYLDYHAALTALPRKGLARDGVHPNVLAPGGLRAACQFTDKGLRYGNNARNLMTLQMLEALRATLAEAATVAATGTDRAVTLADARTLTDAGTAPVSATTPAPVPSRLPFSALLDKSELGTVGIPRGCGLAKKGARMVRIPLSVEEPTRIRAVALDLDGYKPRLFWIRIGEKGERCVRRRNQALEVAAQPGLWDLIVEVPPRAVSKGRMLVLINRNSR